MLFELFTSVVCFFIILRVVGYFLRNNKAPYKALVILGSGGHTTEMFRFLATLPSNFCYPSVYVMANTDKGSQAKVLEFENNKKRKERATCYKIPRSREVNQSYFSSIFTTLYAVIPSLSILIWERPDIVFANGPGTCVPLCLLAYMLRVVGLLNTKIVLSESFACVHHLSLTTKILQHFVDLLTVQWPQLLNLVPKAIYTGVEDSKKSGERKRDSSGYVLITVGSTKFEQLIETVDNISFLRSLKQMGYSGIHVQKGKGKYMPKIIKDGVLPDFECAVYDYLPSLADEMKGAGLVIGHAGAGTILEVLGMGKDLVVVPNNTLMRNHQKDIAKELAEHNYLVYVECDDLVKEFETLQFSSICKFPTEASSKFRIGVEALFCKQKTT